VRPSRYNRGRDGIDHCLKEGKLQPRVKRELAPRSWRSNNASVSPITKAIAPVLASVVACAQYGQTEPDRGQGQAVISNAPAGSGSEGLAGQPQAGNGGDGVGLPVLPGGPVVTPGGVGPGSSLEPDRPRPPTSPVDGAGGGEAAGGSSAGPGTGGASAAGANAGGNDPTGAVGGSAGSARGPTPRSATSNFPFPQNRPNERCVYPTNYDNTDVVAAFEKWKADTVTADGAGGHLRVKRPNEPGLEVNSTVSEGIAYGMLIAVYMDEQELFDELWKYEQQWLDGRGLMDWYINAAGDQVLGGGAASDADEDMAWALVMADRQWGGSGSLGSSYLDIAKDVIGKVWAHEIQDGQLLKPGDSWGDWSTVNVSYFMPNYYRTFAEVSGNAEWNNVVVTSYDTLENTMNDQNGNTTNGLVPAWATSEGSPNAGVWGGDNAPTHYQYDSCRTPFRIAVDYCFHGEPRALAYVEKTTSFFAGLGAAGIVDGYDLNGTPRPEFGPAEQSSAFVGPAGVGAMGVPNQGLVDETYEALIGLDLLVGGTYYDESWMVLSLLMMTGNFLDYTQHEPL
jgi:endo-1,4-beta-D-glucanase Y